jgi:hypothetical protein
MTRPPEYLVMTNSISSGSRNKLFGATVMVCGVLAVLGVLGIGQVAHAGGKRVVVLNFDGPRADKFHDDVVRLIRKTHTVVPIDRWNAAAEEMNAVGVSERNIKRVANKLKIDAVVEGTIEKRRDDFLIRLKLHHGKSGEVVGNPVATKAAGPRIDGRAQREIQEELVDAIDRVESSHAGVKIEDDEEEAGDGKKSAAKKNGKKAERPEKGEDDEEEGDGKKPAAKRNAKKVDEEEDERPAPLAKKNAQRDKAGDDEEAEDARKPGSSKKGFARLSEDQRGGDRVERDDRKPSKKAGDDEDEEDPLARKPAREERVASKPAARPADDGDDEDRPRKPAKPAKKRVAAREDRDREEVDAEARPLDARTALTLGERAVDAVAGISLTMRKMTFAYRADLAARPAGYSGRPVGGAMLDATLYPLALAHTRSDVYKDLGINLMYDRVLFINSRDPATGMVYATKESRYRIAGVFRHALWDSPKAMVVAGSLGYGSQLFTIAGAASTPSVQYTMLEPGGSLRVPLTSTIAASIDARLLVLLKAGQIAAPTQYGDTSGLGFEGGLAVDYRLTRNVFARAAVRFETIRLTFAGNGDLARMRDGDPETQDVSGARDTYTSGFLTAGYLY